MTIETKYNIGDKVWGKKWNTPCRLTIKGVIVKAFKLCEYIEYVVVEEDNIPMHYIEQNLYPTKEELLKSL